MKTFLLLLLSLPAFGQQVLPAIGSPVAFGGGGSAVTAVQHKIVNTPSLTTSTCAMTVSSGNLMACFVQTFDSASYFTLSIADAGNTWTQQGTTVNNADRHITSAMFTAPVTSAGARSIVATASGVPNGGITCACYEATKSGSTPVVDDKTTHGSSGSTSTALSCGALTITGTSDLVIAGTQTTASNNAFTAGSGFTKDGCYNGGVACSGATDIGAAESEAAVSSNLTPTWTVSTAAYWTTECMALK